MRFSIDDERLGAKGKAIYLIAMGPFACMYSLSVCASALTSDELLALDDMKVVSIWLLFLFALCFQAYLFFGSIKILYQSSQYVQRGVFCDKGGQVFNCWGKEYRISNESWSKATVLEPDRSIITITLLSRSGNNYVLISENGEKIFVNGDYVQESG